MTTTKGILPDESSKRTSWTKEEGNVRLAAIRSTAQAAAMERLRARQRIENTFNDRRES